MGTFSDMDIIVEEGIELVNSGTCLADAMRILQSHYEFFCIEYDCIMMNIINRIPNKIYR